MKKLLYVFLVGTILFFSPVPARADTDLPEFDYQEQLDALGRDELMEQVPDQARELMEQSGLYELSVDSLLDLSPRHFFAVLWQSFLRQLKMPLTVLATILGIVLLCALFGGMQDVAGGETSLSPVVSTISILCILTAIAAPVLDCIIDTAKAIQHASTFMLTFIPMFSAAMVASGQPVTGLTYNAFLFATCQVVAQVVARTLIPLMGIYLALCITGPIAPGIKMDSATSTIKSVVSWSLGFILTIFVGFLSVQTLVAGSADSVTTRTAKFLIGSFIPVVGSALSEAYVAAQGCLRLVRTSLGAYGILVAALTFLPIVFQTVSWYMLTSVAAIASDILGIPKISSILKSCGSVLGVLLAIIFCYALLIVVSTTIVMVTGVGGGV